MSQKDITYKHGAWRVRAAEKPLLNKNRLLVAIIDKLKRDIENNDPNDKTAQGHVNELLYHYCWKLNAEKIKVSD